MLQTRLLGVRFPPGLPFFSVRLSESSELWEGISFGLSIFGTSVTGRNIRICGLFFVQTKSRNEMPSLLGYEVADSGALFPASLFRVFVFFTKLRRSWRSDAGGMNNRQEHNGTLTEKESLGQKKKSFFRR